MQVFLGMFHGKNAKRFRKYVELATINFSCGFDFS